MIVALLIALFWAAVLASPVIVFLVTEKAPAPPAVVNAASGAGPLLCVGTEEGREKFAPARGAGVTSNAGGVRGDATGNRPEAHA